MSEHQSVRAFAAPLINTPPSSLRHIATRWFT